LNILNSKLSAADNFIYMIISRQTIFSNNQTCEFQQ
jgi:hypothetical protein